MTGTLQGVSNKHCLLSFFFILSNSPYENVEPTQPQELTRNFKVYNIQTRSHMYSKQEATKLQIRLVGKLQN